jgi:NAD(P)H dehydrogenase (quinone)
MHALIVLAHPDRRSFNGRLAEAASQALRAMGYTVELSDLYGQDFDAREGAWHYGYPDGETAFDVQAAQRLASDRGTLPADVTRELERVERADLMILQYPMWWFAAPAMLKGWIDRVLVYGRTYTSRMRYDGGHLKGKRAMVSVTLGGAETTFAHNGRNGDIELLLWPVQMSLHYVGLTVLPPFTAFDVSGDRSDPQVQAKLLGYLHSYRERLSTIETVRPLSFNVWADWDEKGQLKPGVKGYSLAMRAEP